MKNKKFLYHGTAKKIKGDRLIPKQAEDLENKKENLYKGVYATDIKEVAISMAIISSKGVGASHLKNRSPFGIIYEGWPKQKEIYLYYLSKEKFFLTPPDKHQYISEEPIKPIKLEKIKVENYLHLIRKATKKEKENFEKKYGEKIE